MDAIGYPKDLIPHLREAEKEDRMSKTVAQMVAELKTSKSEFVSYGESDLGISISREDAIIDIQGMDDEQIGEGTWYECDANGNVKE